ncbi:MAG TPA: hypothetical protein VL053_17250 [Arachidicoccus sp.]|nr:hypothetical protein [Arachidicoccus sp.]
MNSYKKIINLLTVLLILATCLAVYALLGKHKSASPVFLFMYNKNVRHVDEDSLAHPRFWDNYPYYTLISTGESVHLMKYLEQDTSELRYIKLANDSFRATCLFYRFHYVASNEKAYRQTFSSIKELATRTIILTDRASFKYLPRFADTLIMRNNIFFINDHLPIYLEKPGLAYFFKISSENRVVDVFVPRAEIPEVTDKYLREIY